MKRPRIGIFKFTSCDGCQLTILNLENEFLELLNIFDIGYFPEAISRPLRGMFDIGIVEGSITTLHQKERVIDIREMTRYLITVGACATSGGLQALRNWASISNYKDYVYPSPQLIESLSTSTPISEHVHVDYELWGCPVNKDNLKEVLIAFLMDRKPFIPGYSLCMECKRHGIPCLIVTRKEPCLGPVTRQGCGALCMSINRPCYGCHGPAEDANIESLIALFKEAGMSQRECNLLLDRMNTLAYRKKRIEKQR